MEGLLTDKLRGGYYTKAEIATWLCKWGIQNKDDKLLEPSCGDGVFLEAAARRFRDLGLRKQNIWRHIKGIEIVPTEAKKSVERILPLIGTKANQCIECAEFFDWNQQNMQTKFDCVVGNPPFIRYQNFPEVAK